MTRSPERIAVAGPSITNREVELVAEAAGKAWYGNQYSYNERFERMVADYCGVAHAVSVPHCTAALHLALASAGIGPGDEVIVPDVTWIASVAPIVYLGGEPILVDFDPITWCISPEAVEAAISPKTKAILGVDLYGSMCDWDRLQEIADRHRLALIEDAAEAFGSVYRGRRAGAFGHAAAFSFHGSKTVTTGEGGMLVTNDERLCNRVLFLRDHGRPSGDRHFLNTEIAFKYRMSAVQAALGVAQMERIDALISMKRNIFKAYRERLADFDGITLNGEPTGVLNSYWMVTAIVDRSFGIDKFALMREFEQHGIDTRPFFSPLSTLTAFDGRPQAKRMIQPGNFGSRISQYGINLPSGYDMTPNKVERVCSVFRNILTEAASRIKGGNPIAVK